MFETAQAVGRTSYVRYCIDRVIFDRDEHIIINQLGEWGEDGSAWSLNAQPQAPAICASGFGNQLAKLKIHRPMSRIRRGRTLKNEK